VPIETGFTLNKLCILGAALIEQFPKDLRRPAKAGNGDVLSTADFSSFKMTPEHKPTALIPQEKAPIPGRVIQSLFIRISAI
jgi:hypothetical protein